ncbi:MAG: alkaline phosphatase family protein [Oligoflexus sp.]|nr:alkaline phosphatase family protein [Oligoflexus sp.]
MPFICSRRLTFSLALSLSLSISLLLVSSLSLAQVAKIKKPKLMLVLVIDQFRADQIARFQKRFLEPQSSSGSLGGFRYLLDQGAYFPFAEYGLLQNMTCPGHATILSGTYAYQNGIAINEWTDRNSGKTIYCVEDDAYPLVGPNLKADRVGISPKNFRGSTVGDELKNSGYTSKVVTIALKDRAAVLLGGYRNDLALWFDYEQKAWISSRYYRPDGKLPTWVESLNQDIAKDPIKELTWPTPKGEGSGTSLTKNISINEKTIKSMAENFPHKVSKESVYSLMLPYGTELTVNAAIAAMKNLKLGQSEDPDLLAVSFSNHDYLSHNFGPNSREVEELTVAEDREISRLLNHAAKTVGMENTIIVLTADHGASPTPEWLKAARVDAGRVDEKKLENMAEDFLQTTFGKPKKDKWLYGVSEFNFFLNVPNIKAANLDREEVGRKLTLFFRDKMPELEGIADAFSASDVRNRSLPPKLWEQLILQTYVADRSGDVILIPKPYFIVPGPTTTHLSGYSYDRMVPLIIAGPQIKAGAYGQKVGIIDIAPTLAFFAGTTPPSGSEGRILSEILIDKEKKK